MINTSLNSQMTSNLLNLQSISTHQATVQQKLATGLKVSSPMQNPNAYYTAISLRSQAQELNSFMDSLGQSVQALKNFDNTLNTGINYLEQALATARVALSDFILNNETSPPVPSPSPPSSPDSIELTGKDLEKIMQENGIKGKVVTTKNEFTEALKNTAQGDTIVLMGQFEFDNASLDFNDITISSADSILRDQGLEDKYFVKDADKAVLNFKIDGQSDNSAFTSQNNVSIKGISINYEVGKSDTTIYYRIVNNSGNLTLDNVNLTLKSNNQVNNYNDLISNNGNGLVTFKGEMNVEVDDNRVKVFHNSYAAKMIQDKSSVINVRYIGDMGSIFDGGIVETYGSVNVFMEGNSANFMSSGNKNIIGGKVTIDVNMKSQIFTFSNRTNLTFLTDADIRINSNKEVKLFDASNQTYQWQKGATIIFNSQTTWKAITNDKKTISHNIETNGIDLSEAFGWEKTTQTALLALRREKTMLVEDNSLLDYLQKETEELSNQKKQISLEAAANRYNRILSYYNDLIGTNSYLGKNLLYDDSMTVKFSTSSNNKLEIDGRNIRSEKMGINQAEWTSAEDIEQSMSEIQNALSDLRQQGREFSNFHSIITNRDHFMSTLSTILTEGADKLTLADINEESANILALSSRQLLAANSLSLAAQSSRSILKLF